MYQELFIEFLQTYFYIYCVCVSIFAFYHVSSGNWTQDCQVWWTTSREPLILCECLRRVHMHAFICGGQKSVFGVFLSWVPRYFKNLSLSLGLTSLARPTNQKVPRDPPVSASPVLGLQARAVSNMGTKDLNLGPYVYIARTFPLGHFPAPEFFLCPSLPPFFPFWDGVSQPIILNFCDSCLITSAQVCYHIMVDMQNSYNNSLKW